MSKLRSMVERKLLDAELEGADAFAIRLSRGFIALLFAMGSLGLLVSAPSDIWFRSEPATVEVLTLWRYSLAAGMVVAVAVMWLVRSRPAFVAACFLVCGAVLGWSAYLFAPLGGLEKPYFSIVVVLPLLTVPLMLPSVWQVILSVYLPMVYGLVYWWVYPELASDIYVMVHVVWTVFSVMAAGVFGWIFRRGLYYGLELRARDREQAQIFRQQSEKLGKLSEQRADAITRLLIERNKLLEQERGRLARDLHDELGQRVAAMNIDVHLLRRKQALEQDSEIWDRLQDGLAGLIKRVREIVHELRPQALEEGGFAKAVEGLLQPLREGTEIKFSTNFRGDSKVLKGRLAEDLFRIVTESITNIVKHSGATEASVDFYFGEDGSVFGSIRDNGVGLATQSQLSGLGLVSMGDRLKAYNGRMFVESTPSGFEVHIAVPPTRKVV